MKSRTDLSPFLGCLPVLLLFVLAGGALLSGVALAQAAGGGILPFMPDLAALYVSPFALALAIGAIVEVAKKHFLSVGGGAVLILSFGVGALLGLGGVWAGYLEGGLAEGAAFGLIAALIASGLYDLIKGFLARWGIKLPDLSAAAPSGQALAFAPASLVGAVAPTVRDFILDQVAGAVSAVKLPAALVAVAPLLAQFTQSEAVLTDELRSKLQGQVLHLLRKAGLTGMDLA